MIYELPDRIGFSLRFFSLTKGTKGATKMRKLLTAGIFGTILGIVGAGTANASIVSSGFLDEKLTEMTNATTLQLDNKANQTDLTALSNKIGTLPSAILPNAWTAIPYYSENRVNMPDAGFPLPTTIGEQLEFLLNAGPDSPIDRMFRIITMFGGNLETCDDPGADFLGLHPLTQKVRSIEENITLPSGNFPEFPESENLFSSFGQPLTYPTSLEGLVTALYGDAETGTQGLLAALVAGYEHPSAHTSIGIFPASANAARALEQIGNIPDGKNLAGMIGTLPAGYDSVGAALTAIKDIAEDAKAAALAAIPDPKQEGSSGKFVLTVDIVGDNATYHWEKIDREGETTTTE